MTYPAIAQGYRERLLKVLSSTDVYAIMRDVGQPPPWTNANECRVWLLANWSNDIRDRVMKIVTDNLEITK